MNTLYLEINGEEVGFDHFWLRDHCSTNFDASTNQRIVETNDIPADVRPISVQRENGHVEIEWNDHHRSQYEMAWLDKNRPISANLGHNNIYPAEWLADRVTWDASSELDLPPFAFDQIMQEESVLAEAFAQIRKVGFAVVKGIPVTREDSINLIQRFGPRGYAIRETYFGRVFEMTGNLEHSDMGYATGDLHAHIDGTYYDDTPRLIVFHLLAFNGTGGKTLMVDGLHIAEKLRAENPKAFETLTQVNVPCQFIENGCYYLAAAPTIRLHPITGEIVQFRFNNEDRAEMHLPLEQMHDFYQAYRALTVHVRDDANKRWIQQEPGMMVFVDNWRVMHGRSGFSGHRHLLGAYVSNEDFVNKQRILEQSG